MHAVRRRFWIESALAGLSAVFLVLTIAWHDWIEIVFGVDPDHHNGSFEWVIVGVCAVVTVVFAVTARVEFRRPRPAAA